MVIPDNSFRLPSVGSDFASVVRSAALSGYNIMLIEANACQLLFVHLQDEALEAATSDDKARLSTAAAVLADIGSRLAIPMTFGLVPSETGITEPLEALRPHSNEANTFERQAASVFLTTPLVDRLDAARRPILLVAGYATEVAVLHATLDALSMGYRVLVAIDAIGGTSPRTEQAALDQITHAGGEISCVATLLSMLAPDFASEPGRTALRLIKSLGSG